MGHDGCPEGLELLGVPEPDRTSVEPEGLALEGEQVRLPARGRPEGESLGPEGPVGLIAPVVDRVAHHEREGVSCDEVVVHRQLPERPVEAAGTRLLEVVGQLVDRRHPLEEAAAQLAEQGGVIEARAADGQPLAARPGRRDRGA